MLGCLYILIAAVAAIHQTAADQNCNLMVDLCIIIDASTSVCGQDPSYKAGTAKSCNNWNDMISFVHQSVNQLDIGQTASRVGVIIFATKAQRQWNLTRFADKPSLLAAIDKLSYTGGNTNTSGALNTMMNLVFSTNFGDRPYVPNVALILTDGRPTDPTTVQAAIDQVHAANVMTYVIGITNLIDVATLQQLSSPPHKANVTYFTAVNFGILAQIFSTVQTQICNGSSPSISCPVVLNLCFILDSSASVCNRDPTFNKTTDSTCNNWGAVISFVHRFVASMNIGPDATRVGVVVFATKAYRRFNTSRFLDQTSLLQAIDALEYISGETNTSGALNVMMNQVLNASFSYRQNVPSVAIIITDGRSTDPSPVQPAIDRVHAANVKTYAIGITNLIDEATLKLLSSPPQQMNQTYFYIDNFNVLNQIVSAVQTQICNAPSG